MTEAARTTPRLAWIDWLVRFVAAFPALGIAIASTIDNATPTQLGHGAAQFSAHLIAFALMISPLRMLFPRQPWISRVRRHRRLLGLSAFGYAIVHLGFYLYDMGTLDVVLAQFAIIGYWSGWAGLLLLVPLAATSNNWSMHALGTHRWQRLHRLVYAAAILVVIHWATIHDHALLSLAYVSPVILLEVWRISVLLGRRRRRLAHH